MAHPDIVSKDFCVDRKLEGFWRLKGIAGFGGIKKNLFQLLSNKIYHSTTSYKIYLILRYDSKHIGTAKEVGIIVNDVSRFILKRDASVRVWYHRESVEMIKNPNIPRQFNLNYEWREGI